MLITLSLIEKCENLTTPSGGSVNVSTDGQISSAEFTCKTGYVLKGQQTTKCQVNLIWDTLETECGKKEFVFFS